MHIYEKNGEKYPSVTTIIHILGNERLMQWANAMGFKRRHIQTILTESARYGTYAHEIARSIIDSNAPNPSVNMEARDLIRLKPMEAKFRQFVRETSLTILKTEFSMVSSSYEYGGTMDAYGSIHYKGKVYNDIIFDFKTAKSVHSTMWLQLGGYYNLCIENDMKPKGAAIIRLNDDSIRFNSIDLDELQAYANAFLHLKKFYDFWKDYEGK